MEYTITKEQILNAFSNPKSLMNLFPEVFRFEKNQWYSFMAENVSYSFFVIDDSDSIWKLRGFSSRDGWMEEIFYDSNFPIRCTKLASEYVKIQMINEARKRGFTPGNIVKEGFPGNGKGNLKIASSFQFLWEPDIQRLLLEGAHPSGTGLVVFQNGEWAEVTEAIEMTMEQLLKVASDKLGINPEQITVKD